jgi:hypothetical protein
MEVSSHLHTPAALPPGEVALRSILLIFFHLELNTLFAFLFILYAPICLSVYALCCIYIEHRFSLANGIFSELHRGYEAF